MTPVRDVRTGSASRATLDKAADENFPVAPFFLPRAWRDDLMAVYGFARLVDDIGDGDLAPGGADAAPRSGRRPRRRRADGRLALLDAFEADLRRVFDGDGPRHPLLRALQPDRAALRAHPGALPRPDRGQPPGPAGAPLRDATRNCSPTASSPPTRSAGSSSPSPAPRARSASAAPTRSAPRCRSSNTSRTSPRTSAATGSTCPPRTWRASMSREADLAAPRPGRVGARPGRVRSGTRRVLLNEGTPLVGSVHGRLKLLLAGFVAGGRAALDGGRGRRPRRTPGTAEAHQGQACCARWEPSCEEPREG